MFYNSCPYVANIAIVECVVLTVFVHIISSSLCLRCSLFNTNARKHKEVYRKVCIVFHKLYFSSMDYGAQNACCGILHNVNFKILLKLMFVLVISFVYLSCYTN